MAQRADPRDLASMRRSDDPSRELELAFVIIDVDLVVDPKR